MRYSILFLLLLHLGTSLLAAPTSTSVILSSISPLSSSSTTFTGRNQTLSALPTLHHPTSASRSLFIPTRPATLSHVRGHGPTFRPTRTVVVSPTIIEEQQHRERSHSSQKPIAIFFEVLGGLAAIAILISCLRCCYIYKRTPKRDRIAAVLQRHQLERELEELERNPLALRRSATNDPVPPYFPPPPTYEVIATTANAAQRSGYAEVSTASPPSSPPLPTRQLEDVSLPTLPRTLVPSFVPNG